MRADTSLIERASVPSRSFSLSAWRDFGVILLVLLLGFAFPIYRLGVYALTPGSLYSHIILIPFVSAYLIWIRRATLFEPTRLSLKPALPFALAGSGLLFVYLLFARTGKALSANDSLSLTIGSFYLFFLGAIVFAFGSRVFRQVLFPLGFLAFIIPFPEAVTVGLETASKYASAEAYAWLMTLFGVTYYRHGYVFELPGLPIEVAQECSGIRSSLVLFITSLIAGYLFLSRNRNRALLAFFVLPLGIARNAVRILILSLLTIHWDPGVIDSPLHHKGGPLFFAASLVPFLLVLFWLYRSERRVSGSACKLC